MATPSCTAFFFWSGVFRPLLVSPVRLSLGEGPQDRSLSKCKVSHHQPHLKFMCRQASDTRDCNNCHSARVSYTYIIRPTYTIQQTYQTLLEHLVARKKSINYGGLRWEGYRRLGTDEKLHQLVQCLKGYRAKRRLATRTCPVLVSQLSVSSVESGSRTIPMPCGTGNETDYLTAGIQAQVPQAAQKFLHVH